MRAPGVALLLAMVGGGCLAFDSGDCQRDSDCNGECANTGECVAEGTSLEVRIRWTVGGVAPSLDNPAPCGDIDHLEVTFEADDEGDNQTYAPVPCEAGQITFTRLPPRFARVRVTAIADPDRTVDSASVRLEPGGETAVAIDFSP
jgi:hypothetical protein